MSKWVYLQQNNGNEEGCGDLSAAVINILKRRGVSGSELPDFLAELPRTTHDPMFMPDIVPALDRLFKAFDNHEKICVYGDYDVDGITSTVVLIEVFSKLTDNICYHVPNRFAEGYGLNNKAIDSLAENGVDLIVTVDCGSASVSEVAYAKEKGMDIIVSDHHTLGDEGLPDCLLINPKREDSIYPFKQLSGCGVAFKIAQAVQRRLAGEGDSRFTKKNLDALLDLVAVSTVADIVPLLDENRTLVKYGLKILNEHRRPGLNALLSELGLTDREIDAECIAFQLAPNINALGRMGSANTAVELLSGKEKDPMKLASLAHSMAMNNAVRKEEQEKTKNLCDEALENEDCGSYSPVIYAPEGHEGVAGIVAGNLKEKYYRPVCILTKGEGGLLKGTGRSVPGINLFELLTYCEQYLARFGGHAGACGFSISPENIVPFRNMMQEYVRKMADDNPDILTEKIYIEQELTKEEKSLDFADKLSSLEPFGAGNERPLFSVSDVKLVALRFMGLNDQHARFTVKGEDDVPVECVIFRHAQDMSALLRFGIRVDVAGELSVNEFNGQRRLQLIVRDMRRH